MASSASIPQMERIWRCSLDIVEALLLSLTALTERFYPAPGMVLRVYLQQTSFILDVGSQLGQRDPKIDRNGKRGHRDRPRREHRRHHLHRYEGRHEWRVWLRCPRFQARRAGLRPAQPLRERPLQRALLPPRSSPVVDLSACPRGRLLHGRERRESGLLSQRRLGRLPMRHPSERTDGGIVFRAGRREVSLHDESQVDGRSRHDACPICLRQRERVYVFLGRTQLHADRQTPRVALGRRCPACHRSRGELACLGDHGVQRRNPAVILEQPAGLAAGGGACRVRFDWLMG